LVIVLFSFGENLEILVYLFWPALLIIGATTRRRFRNPLFVVHRSENSPQLQP
jgi:hypothetical protein